LSILTSADRFRYELEKLVEADIDRLKDTLSLGFLDDYAQYKAIAGRIAGLRAAIDFCHEAEKRCNLSGEGE